MRRLALLLILLVPFVATGSPDSYCGPNASRCGGDVGASVDTSGFVVKAGKLTQFTQQTSSAEFGGVISDEQGNCSIGKVVCSYQPTLVAPNLGTPASGLMTNTTTATAAANDNSTKIASTGFVQQEINNADGTGITCSGGTCSATLGTSIDGSELTASINILTTGTIQGRGKVTVLTDPNVILVESDLADDTHYCNNSSGCFYQLPAVESGMTAAFYNFDGTGVITLKPNGSDVFHLNGLAADAGEGIVSPTGKGGFIAFQAIDSTNIVTWGVNGSWAEQTPP